MHKLHYSNVKGRAGEIIEDILAVDTFSKQQEMMFTFNLVCEEIVTNVVNYAYPDDTDGPLTIEVDETDDAVVLSFIDCGTPFNPLAKDPPDTSLPPDKRPIGGLGIFLVQQMMDDVAYCYEEGRNVFTVKKNTN